MSLINQVLNDLEKRGASTKIGEDTVRVVPVRQGRGVLWLLLVAVSVTVLLATAWLKWGADAQLDSTSFVHASAPVLAPVAAQAAASAVSGVVDTPLVSNLNMAASAVVPAVKPALPMVPVITGVSPNPAISLGLAQAVTISGSNYEADANLILRTPRGKKFSKRKLVMQDSAQIVVSANFRNIAGAWSAEVVNNNGQSSGPYEFTVQAAPAAAKPPVQQKSAAPDAVAQSAANPAPVNVTASGVSKQQTQITPQQQAENEFRKAYQLMQQGQANAAISGYEAALQLDAGHLMARQTLVRLLLENKRNTDAERVLQEGLQFDSRQHSLAMLLARMQVGRNELAQALDTMQKSLPYAEKQADYQAFIAALLQRQNRHLEAIGYFQNALQLSPQSGVWLMGLGISLRAEQRNAEARDAFNRALETRTLSAELQSFVTKQLQEL